MQYVPTTRQSVQWAQEELSKRGLHISTARIRRYSRIGIITTGRRKSGGRLDRLFTEDDLNRLEVVVILKGLGFSHKAVRQWMTDPDPSELVYKIDTVRGFIGRATELAKQVKEAYGGKDGNRNTEGTV